MESEKRSQSQPRANAILNARSETGRSLIAALHSGAELSAGFKAEPYRVALARVRHRLNVSAPFFARERAEAGAQVAELLRQPRARRRLLIHNCDRFRSLSLARSLIVASSKNGSVEPSEAESIARLAIEVAESLEEKVYGRGLIADTFALSWAQIADCRRRQGDVSGAEAGLRVAHQEARRGSGECQVLARLLAVEAALRQQQLCFDEGERLLNRAVRLCRSSGDELHQGLTLSQQASMVRDAGEPKRARWLVREALRHLGAGSMPSQHLEAKLLLIDCEAELGNLKTAEALLQECALEAEEIAHEVLELRHRWLEGRVMRGLERFALAEEAFLSAREGYEAIGREGDAALVSLDLAALYRARGRRSEMVEVVSRVLPYFSRQASHRELSAASRQLLETSLVNEHA